MKYFFLMLAVVAATSCMKSKEEYRQAITDIQEEQEIQREEAVPGRNLERSRGSNDAEGMGMDE
jgi:hypothetical protein